MVAHSPETPRTEVTNPMEKDGASRTQASYAQLRKSGPMTIFPSTLYTNHSTPLNRRTTALRNNSTPLPKGMQRKREHASPSRKPNKKPNTPGRDADLQRHLPDTSISNERCSTPWNSQLKAELYKNGEDMLHYEVLSFVHWMTPTPVEHQARLLVVEQIRREITRNSKKAAMAVEPFGSLVTGLYLPDGDIDIVARFPSNVKVKSTLHSLSKRLHDKGIARDIKVISGARVPIIKMTSALGE
ncbi:hypothetical protein FRC02_010137 [Tulasnella sp. 418]|nr:hypothetical protein FRC02_010137 [Tulasnella sp. 418]